MAKPTLNVTVVYPAAGKPFHDHDANPAETLLSLWNRVLATFGLQEGEENGNQVTYPLYKGKERLTDMSLTLGAVAGNAGALSLQLSQQIVQG